MLDTASKAVATVSPSVDVGSSGTKIRDMVKKYVSSQDPQCVTVDSGRSINVDRGAPSTQLRRKRVEDFWFAFLEEKGLQREWDHKGPKIGMY